MEAGNRSRLRTVLCWVGGLVGFAVCGAGGAYAALVVLVLASFQPLPLHPRPFDASLWNRPDWRESFCGATHLHSIRQRMVDDLLGRHLRVGMSESEVLELLGPWDEGAYFRSPDPEAWVYWLGIERHPLALDFEWLFVSFDAQGKVTRAFLATD